MVQEALPTQDGTTGSGVGPVLYVLQADACYDRHLNSPHRSTLLTDASPAPAWRELVRPYSAAVTRRSLTQLLITAAVFLTTTAGLIAGLYFELWYAFILAVPAAAFFPSS